MQYGIQGMYISKINKKSLRYQRGNQNPYMEEEQTTETGSISTTINLLFNV
jgi:hypothetical protein